jgi:hypothetical protein
MLPDTLFCIYTLILIVASTADLLELSIAGAEFNTFHIYANESSFKNETIWREYMQSFCSKCSYDHIACEKIKQYADIKIKSDDFIQSSYSPSGSPEYMTKDSYYVAKSFNDQEEMKIPVSAFRYSLYIFLFNNFNIR